MKYKSFSLLVVFIVLYSSFIIPQWVSDPTTNLAICTVAETQREARICNDGAGNIFIFWRDYRNEPTIFGGDIFAQKLDMLGMPQWVNNGTSLVSGFGGQFDPQVLNDNENGFYLIWRTTSNSFKDYTLHAQRFTNNGNKMWGTSGITVQSGLGTVTYPIITLDEQNNLLITWLLVHIGSNNDLGIFVQKIDKNGAVKWGSSGLALNTLQGILKLSPQISNDLNGGAIVVWSDNRNSNSDIYAQRVSSTGIKLWQENGLPICEKTGSQNANNIISDDNGGALIFWEDVQETSYNVCVQRIDSSGNKLFGADGKVLLNSSAPLGQYEFLLDKNKEIFLFWSTLEGNIYAQKVDYNGNLIWANPVSICTTQNPGSNLALAKSDNNGIIISWFDKRNVNNDIYSQWISADGVARWNNNGAAICNETHEQSDCAVIEDKSGGAVLAWADMRNGNFDIYTQNVDVRGKLGSNKYLYRKNGLNKIISNSTPDSLLVTLPILEGTGYYSITVLLDTIIHPAVNELAITLTHAGITDTIVYNLSGGQNFMNTYLDDFALNLISTSAAPFTGIYKPYNPLSSFMNSDLNGEWIITIEDNNIANNGTLKSWGLVFNKGEITDIEYEGSGITPNDFSLEQNYPNPFNPSTTIRYSIPEPGKVTLKVYDILGREVITLRNEEQTTGTYEVKLNANTLSSGVYFYQLRAGSYIQTRKMILLK